MSERVHVLVVRAAGAAFALPMDAVEQTFDLTHANVRGFGGKRAVQQRGSWLELRDLAVDVGLPRGTSAAGVIVWAGGRRRVFAVDSLVGQMELERHDLPEIARSRFANGVCLLDGEVVPVLMPGAVCGAYELGAEGGYHFSQMQRSALFEVANIGSGHAATALSQLLGRSVEISYTEALLASLAEAADRLGAAAETSAVVDTPVADDHGRVLLLFPESTATELCALLGCSPHDEMGESALREVGNILASSYLNAIVEMTGLTLEPEPPEVEVDLLGKVVERRLAGKGTDELAILMRSLLTVESSDASFSFLFVPQLDAISSLLERLGLGAAA